MNGGKSPLSVLAPAKINLDLHITGRTENGYHLLDSLVAFADIGDRLLIETADDFSFAVQGPYASAFTAHERAFGPDSGNMAVKAVWALCQAVQKKPRFKITLTKNLPLASGLGGGSADAAAVIWGLMEWWILTPQAVLHMPEVLEGLGADVPACISCRPLVMRGTGNILEPAPAMDEIPILLVNPGKHCPTPRVFAAFDSPFGLPDDPPADLSLFDDLAEYLNGRDNMLTQAAITVVPEIADVLSVLLKQEKCALARMSGSGATCFGLFREEEDALNAAATVAQDRPGWWVRAGTLNRPERY